MNSNKKSILNYILILGISLCLTSCMLNKPDDKSAQKRPQFPPPGVTVTKISKIKITETEKYTGKIYARDVVNIVARVQGYLEKHYFSEGAIVKQHSLLFLIEPDQYQAEVEQAKADIENIKATLVNDEKELARVDELIKEDYISHSRFDQSLAKRDESIAILKAKEAALKKAELNLAYTKIYAPIMGKIGGLEVTEGNLVGPQTGTLATIVKLDPIYVTYNIPADDFTKLRLKLSKEGKSLSNKPIELILNDGTLYPYKGSIDFFDNKVDETTGTIKIRAKFSNPAGVLLPGQLCQVVIYADKPVLKSVIDQSAVLEDSTGKYVYILEEGNTVKKQDIKVGQQTGKYWTIEEGLTANDSVVLTGLQKIREGMKVNILPEKSENKGKN